MDFRDERRGLGQAQGDLLPLPPMDLVVRVTCPSTRRTVPRSRLSRPNTEYGDVRSVQVDVLLDHEEVRGEDLRVGPCSPGRRPRWGASSEWASPSLTYGVHLLPS